MIGSLIFPIKQLFHLIRQLTGTGDKRGPLVQLCGVQSHDAQIAESSHLA